MTDTNPPDDSNTADFPMPGHAFSSTILQTSAPPQVLESQNGIPTIPGYTIHKTLGRGGMGIVYQADSLAMNRPVAIKMILSGQYASAIDIARFLTEADAGKAIEHPNVIDLYEIGQVQGRPFFAMEYLTGGSLSDRLKSGGPMEPKFAAELIVAIASGIQAAHDLGIVHRDLKPDNILFDTAGVPKITDFGLAKRTSAELTATGAVMGTPAYMAPEQAAGQTRLVGPAGDLYTLGVIFFECLTGRVPFQSDNLMSLLGQIRESDPPRLKSINENLPKQLQPILDKCLAKEPKERYPSAAAFANDLRRFTAGKKPLAGTKSTWSGMWATLDRSRYAAEFAIYSRMFLWLALIMFTADVCMGLFLNGIIPLGVGVGASNLRIIGVPLFVWFYTGRQAVDGSPNSRFLLSLWGGHLAACLLAGICELFRLETLEYRGPKIYQFFSLVTGVAFVALAPNYWGWCYAFGAMFFLMPLVLVYNVLIMPYAFAALWAFALICVSRHLSKLAKGSEPTHQPSPAASVAGKSGPS